jgi:hypothetical protein
LFTVSFLHLKIYHFFRNNGKTVFVKIAENCEVAKSISEGNVITVKHHGTNAYGTLQFPKFYRERKDMVWNDVLDQL